MNLGTADRAHATAQAVARTAIMKQPRNPLHLTVSKPGEEFIYQSCTGNRGTTSFGGEIKFRLVPENEKREDHVAYNNRPLDKGLGFFNVKLETFPIDPMDELDWVL